MVQAERIQRMLDNVDWDAHWERVIRKVSQDADAYEEARAASRSRAAGKFFA
jgi:hypothetical protein